VRRAQPATADAVAEPTDEPVAAPGERPAGSLPAFAAGPVAAIAALLAAVLTALSGRYGYHRDELYFVVAGGRPDWGYIDQPPLTPLLARLSTTVFGDTLVGLRVVATLSAVLSVVMLALVARELGAGRRAQVLAAAAAAGSSIVLATGHMVSTATFDLLAWLAISWLVLRLLRTGDGRWYLAIGAVAGLGILNKYLVFLLLAGLLVSIAVVGPRRVLRTWWLAAGIAVAAVVMAPNLWWQAAHDWPQLSVAAGISDRDGGENRALFVPLQFVYLSPVFAPFWVAGLVRLWRAPDVRWARAFGLAYPLLGVLVLAFGGKAYYVIALLLVALAAGMEPAVRWASRSGRHVLVATTVVVAGLVNVVATLPVLPPSALNVINGMNKEQGEQVGWPALAGTVAGAWQRIPAGERDRAVVFAQNYGEAGAIARYGPGHGLPMPYSGHMSYADWGPPPDDADGPVIVVQYPENRGIGRFFTGCEQVAVVDNGVGLDNDEQGSVVQLCSGTTAPWSRLWSQLRHN
jgi:4-amino-4-deoxy-L-arabinose transferase-like glycosyltransferase